jgi:tight adherence protein C
MAPGLILCAVLGLAGAAIMAGALVEGHRAGTDVGEFLPPGFGQAEFEDPLAKPFLVRVLGGARSTFSRRVEQLLPGKYLEQIDRQLVMAGLSGRWRAGDQLSVQVVFAGLGLLAAFLAPSGSTLMHVSMLVLLPVVGFMLPSAHLKRKVQARSDAIFKDLPDVVDMLAICVEAGSGFEAAMSLVCENFDSPFTDELSIALKEMELGLPRREALHQLRDRIDLDVVRTLVLALLQADALGIPIGRILKSQSTEVRMRRRAWAREKAGKLPVKIMFPLVLFIFPPIMALVIGPAAMNFGKLS